MVKKPIFFSPPRGMRDILPDEHSVASYIKKVIRYRCRQSGIRRITTTIFERPLIVEHLPKASWGDDVHFTLATGASNDLVLRHGFMWGIWRAYTTYKMMEAPAPQELYALDLCFDTEVQQDKLLVRQYLAFGVEIMGEEDPALDAQLLKLWQTICSDVDLATALQIKLSKVGDHESRGKFLSELEQYYVGKDRSLCQNCRANLAAHNYLPLLTCSEEDCQILAKLAPKLEKYFTPALKEFYQNLEEYLEALGVKYEWQENLFPQNHTFFEPLFGQLFLDDQCIGHIGHYHGILAEPDLAGIVGRSLFIDLEKVIQIMTEKKVFVPFKDNIHVYVAQLGPEAKKRSLALLCELRDHGIKVIGSMGKGSMQEQADIAYKFRIPYCLLLGRMEVAENIVIVRDMKTGKRESVPMANIVDFLLAKIPPAELDRVGLDKARFSDG